MLNVFPMTLNSALDSSYLLYTDLCRTAPPYACLGAATGAAKYLC